MCVCVPTYVRLQLLASSLTFRIARRGRPQASSESCVRRDMTALLAVGAACAIALALVMVVVKSCCPLAIGACK